MCFYSTCNFTTCKMLIPKNMDCLLNLLFLYYFFVLLVDAMDAENLEKTSRKRAFCGKRLTNILGQFCLEFPSRENDRPFRVKRQIISECCENKCSLNYLLENYCQAINTAALEAFKEADDDFHGILPFPLPASTTPSILSRRYRQKNSLENIIVGSNESTTSQTKDHVKKRRKRRNCPCKKQLKLKKLRQERRFWRILANKNFVIQQPEIGEIESHQTPFYVFS